ncbi:MAG: TIGR01777 family oxidoreductase [Anaerolineales bacterium]
MKVLLAGGSGFLGRHLTQSLLADKHRVWVLSRRPRQTLPGVHLVPWDGRTPGDWRRLMDEMDAVVNLSGLSLNNWPWTKAKKQRFLDSRVAPGLALASAISSANRRPDVFVQISGINHYGLHGAPADENTPPADDYLAQLTVAWEDATRPVEDLGVRRVICRTAVVLARDASLMQLMALPVRLFTGGPLGHGGQALPWIHIADQIGAIRFLMENRDTSGPYNLIAPQPTSNAEFMRTLAQTLHRPYWLPIPAFLMRLALGEMSNLVLEGRFAYPKRLLEAGYTFHFPTLQAALQEIFQSET